MKAMKRNKAKMKKISMIMTGIAAVFLSGALCTAQTVHASGMDASAPEAVSYEGAAAAQDATALEADSSENAAGSQVGNWPVDTEKSDCSIDLELTYKQDGKDMPLNGGSLALYTVATVRIENGYVYDVSEGKFASVSGVSSIPGMTAAQLEAQNPALAKAMEAAAATLKAEPDAVAAIKNGKATFAGLKAGLYLIAQKDNSDGARKINAFLISIPDAEGSYNVEAAPKNGIAAPPTSTPTPAPKTSITPKTTITPRASITPRPKVTTTVRKTTLPQTGQAWLPVFVLAAVGVAFVVIGRRVSR